jgi:phage-related protein
LTLYAQIGIIQLLNKQTRKPLKWIGSAKRDLDAMPEDVKDVFGHAIDLAQAGGKHQDAKAMSGFGSAGVLEMVEDFRSDTYRAVYTVKFAGWVYVLHCFQKKSKSGIKTPKEDMDLINARLKAAKQDFETWKIKQGASR